MKETEEETFIRIKEEYAKSVDFDSFDDLYLSGTMTEGDINKLMKLYHQERLKSSLPSEQEIDKIAEAWTKRAEHPFPDKNTYKKGFQDALTLLTKGDR